MNARLFHYTCDHGNRGIRADGALRANRHPLLRSAGPLIWLTDLDVPDRHALGLTSNTLSCDRTAHRFTVDATKAIRWHIAARTLCTTAERRQLEFAPGALPMHWWVMVGCDLVPVLERAELNLRAGA